VIRFPGEYFFRIAIDQAEQALRRLDALRWGALRRLAHHRSPRDGRLFHTIEDTSMGDLDGTTRVDVEREHRAVHPIGIGKTAISAMRAPWASRISHTSPLALIRARCRSQSGCCRIIPQFLLQATQRLARAGLQCR
jgi:hypothetical protein